MLLRPISLGYARRRDRLILDHLGLVPPIAHNIRRSLPPQFLIEDLLSSGVLGLVEAAVRFRPQPGNAQAQFRAFARLRILRAIVDSVRRGQYANATACWVGDVPEPAAIIRSDSDNRCDLARLCVGLTDQEARLLDLRYWQELSPRAAAHQMGLKEWRVRALHARAIRKLRLAAQPDFPDFGDYTGRVPTKGAKTPQTVDRARLVDQLGALQEEIAEREKREAVIIKQIREWAEDDTKPGKPIVYQGRMYVAAVTARGSRQKVTDKPRVLVILGKDTFLEHCGFTVEKAEKLLTAEQFEQVITVDKYCSPRRVETAPRAELSAKPAARKRAA